MSQGMQTLITFEFFSNDSVKEKKKTRSALADAMHMAILI
jgi:hypothetical protein